MTREITVGSIKIGGNNPIVLIAGPCVIEDLKITLWHAEKIKEITDRLNISFIFKSSYDKANRSSINSFRGPGIEKGLRILKRIKERLGLVVLSDIHCREEINEAKEVLDIIQIPAFLCRQTDLIVEAARTGRVINIKKGQFLAPWDVKNIIEKVERVKNKQILITERGTSFGYSNLVSDFRSIQIIRGFGYPVVYDATHSVQLPGALGGASGGERSFIPALSRAAVAVGCDGIFLEVHKDPDSAPCDGPNMINLETLEELLLQVKEIDRLVKRA